MRLVVDVETDHLNPPEVKNIWCIVAKDVDSERIYKYTDPHEAKELLANAGTIIGHNAISFDYCVLERFLPNVLDPKIIVDTLVLSKLLKYTLDDGEGHSLEAWGNRFRMPKHPSPDFSVFSNEMLEYCQQDVEINTQLYLYLLKYLDNTWNKAIETEMSMAWICLDMHLNGFRYDKEKADSLKKDLEERLAILDEEIIQCFPPKLVPVREVTPRLTKHGTLSKTNLPRDWTDLTRIHADCPFVVVKSERFNPGSSSQTVARLTAAGWDPIEPTKTGKSFKINEVNLATLPEQAPEGARKLVERLLIAARVRTLKEWEAAYRPETERIHGRFNSIGTWPGRMSHNSPNMGNIATRKSIKYKGEYLKTLATDLGSNMRSLWQCPDGCWLVGTDMEAAHVRLFAHFIDDKEFIKAVISGDKKNGTDVHTLNKNILGSICADRDLAKTFLFSFFNGAGVSKVSEIFGCSYQRASRALKDFNERYPGIKALREGAIPVYARQGWFPGLDGRAVTYAEEHGMFAGMLQSGEAVVMKMANILWRKELNERGIKSRQVNLVHDEYVTEYAGAKEIACTIGQLQCQAISDVGRSLSLRCPLEGEYKVGKNWLEVH